MKMVSASKLRKVQNAIIKMRPYSAKLREIMGNLSQSVDAENLSVFTQKHSEGRILIIVVSSNRGLCGAFNANIIKTANNLILIDYEKDYNENNVDVICIGKKVSEYFSKRKFNVIEANNHITETLSFENTSPIAEKLMEMYTKGTYKTIEIIYNQFKNAATQQIVVEQFLPISTQIIESAIKKQETDYILEPSREVIIQEIIPKSLKIQFYKVLLDSVASEHGARMTAMHKATENANDLVKALRLSYNKARQAAITTEIIEIVSGAEALKG